MIEALMVVGLLLTSSVAYFYWRAWRRAEQQLAAYEHEQMGIFALSDAGRLSRPPAL
jgi:hypothetical protein